jgi:hypothetical protein
LSALELSPLLSAATDWIGALSTLFLGLVGLFVTVWQWLASGFRPRVTAEVDPRRQAIRVDIYNGGRGGGVISDACVTSGGNRLEADIEGFHNGFVPTLLPGQTSMSLIMMAPGETVFPADAVALVRWANHRADRKPQPIDVGLFGLPSTLPPKS